MNQPKEEKPITVTVKGWWWKRWFKKYRLKKWLLEKESNAWYEEKGEKFHKAVFDQTFYGKPINMKDLL
jgi:hypothetical protein